MGEPVAGCVRHRGHALIDPAVDRAAQILREGGLVAFPTETVYGLGADASSREALRRLYAVKGRPSAHPVIVHLASVSQLRDWAVDVSASARALAEAYWPGPLTMVLRRAPHVLDEVTGGRDTVGLRVPNSPLALALLEAFGGGVAAPSANRFGHVSPTTAEAVRAELGDDVDEVLDGGPCDVGVESTIVELIGERPTLLRPGAVTVAQLEAVLGGPIAAPRGESRAPGMLASHYAPTAVVEVVTADALDVRASELRGAGKRVVMILPSADLDADARALYARLRAADKEGAEVVLAVLPPEEGIGAAIADRLRKAAGPRG
jgi:L-threonylcarbamoyladenylate synthase